MRHRVSGRKLGRKKDQRKALFRNLITELYRYERIKTTEAKAKAVRGKAEKLITIAKRGDVQARRRVMEEIKDEEVVDYLFDVLAPDFADRPGGYTRIVKIGPRKGDGAPMVLLELV